MELIRSKLHDVNAQFNKHCVTDQLLFHSHIPACALCTCHVKAQTDNQTSKANVN